MRTDVKVGLALGALFLIVAVSYYGTKKSNDTLPLAEGGVQQDTSDLAKVDQVVQRNAATPSDKQQAERPQRKATTPATRTAQNASNRRPRPARQTAGSPRTQQQTPAESQVAANTPGQPAGRLPESFRAVNPRQPAAGAVPQAARSEASEPEAARAAQGTTGRIPEMVNERPMTPEEAQRRAPARTVQQPAATRSVPKQDAAQRATPRGTRRASATRTHTVQAGDSFAALAERYYGSQRYTQQLLDANSGVDPRRMQIGTVLQIPELDAAGPARAPSSAPAPKRTTTRTASTSAGYVVASGDTLYDIASKQLGDGSRWREIHELNAAVIGNDPHALKVGMVLVLPR